MSGPNDRLSLDAAHLRAAFDRTYAEPPGERAAAQDELLAIRVGGDRFAVRLEEISAIQADRKVVRIPSPSVSLLGVTAVRGVLAPVHDLRVLLGYPAPGTPRWLLFMKSAEPLGLAFEQFDAHLRQPRKESLPAAPGAGEHARPHVRFVIDSPSGPLPLLDLTSILSTIQAANERPKER